MKRITKYPDIIFECCPGGCGTTVPAHPMTGVTECCKPCRERDHSLFEPDDDERDIKIIIGEKRFKTLLEMITDSYNKDPLNSKKRIVWEIFKNQYMFHQNDDDEEDTE
jgi:hypothetical protein